MNASQIVVKNSKRGQKRAMGENSLALSGLLRYIIYALDHQDCRNVGSDRKLVAA